MIISGIVCVIESDKQALRETDIQKAVLRVKLLDVTRIDDAAQMVAARSFPPQMISRGSEVAFALDVTGRILPNHRYELAAHLDIDGNELIDRGDFITMEAFPWPEPLGTSIYLKLRLVRS